MRIITSLNEEMLNSHNKNKSDITIALQTHKINIPFAVLETDEIKIREINEKPTISKKDKCGHLYNKSKYYRDFYEKT